MSAPGPRPGPRPGPHPGPHHGGAAIAALDGLPLPQACAVRLLREWCDGTGGASPPGFDELARLIVHEGRRPLLRHHAACACVGSDEAVFALLLTVAATGEREDAMMLAALLVPADRMGLAAHLAQVAGLAIARACLTTPAADARPASAPLH